MKLFVSTVSQAECVLPALADVTTIKMPSTPKASEAIINIRVAVFCMMSTSITTGIYCSISMTVAWYLSKYNKFLLTNMRQQFVPERAQHMGRKGLYCTQ